MNHRFQLNHLILHYIGMRAIEPEKEGAPAKEKWRRQAKELQNIVALDEAIVRHLLALIEDTWDHPDAGAVHSARFEPKPKKPERSKVHGYFRAIRDEVWPRPAHDPQAGLEFLARSQEIDDRLFECTTLAASPGLLMVADFSPSGGEARYLALLKIRHVDERFVTILQDSLTDLGVQDVEMMLTREILKGAIWPHPTRSDYDLKLIDRQAKVSRAPARYFTEEFLGCQAKDPDARQADMIHAKLVRDLAQKHGWKLTAERTDDFIVQLLEETAPTAERVARTASEAGLIEGADPDQLCAVVEERLVHQLPHVLSAQQLEPDLEQIAVDRGWTYRPGQGPEFRAALDHALRLDEGKLTTVMIESGLLKDADRGATLRSLEEMGGVDIPRQTLVMRTKAQRRLLRYHFDVPRRPESTDFVRVTISGPPETVRRFLTREKGGNYVFSIEATPTNFDREFR